MTPGLDAHGLPKAWVQPSRGEPRCARPAQCWRAAGTAPRARPQAGCSTPRPAAGTRPRGRCHPGWGRGGCPLCSQRCRLQLTSRVTSPTHARGFPSRCVTGTAGLLHSELQTNSGDLGRRKGKGKQPGWGRGEGWKPPPRPKRVKKAKAAEACLR